MTRLQSGNVAWATLWSLVARQRGPGKLGESATLGRCPHLCGRRTQKLERFKIPHVSKQVLVVIAVIIDESNSSNGRTWLNHALGVS